MFCGIGNLHPGRFENQRLNFFLMKFQDAMKGVASAAEASACYCTFTSPEKGAHSSQAKIPPCNADFSTLPFMAQNFFCWFTILRVKGFSLMRSFPNQISNANA